MAENVIQFSLLGVDKFSGVMGKLRSTLGSVIKVIAKAAVAMVAAGGAILALVNKFADLQDKVGKFASRLGVAVDELSAYQFVAQQSGISTEQFNMALQRATRRIAEAAQGMGEGAGALKELGIEAKEFTKLGVEDKLTILADKLEGVTSESDKLRIAFKLFDSEGTAMLQMLKGGSAAMKAAAEDARFLGVVMSAQGTANAKNFKDEMGRAGSSIKGVGLAISQELMPILTPMLKAFANGTANMRDSIITALTEGISFIFTFFNIIKQVFSGIHKIFTDVSAFNTFTANIQLFIGATINAFLLMGKVVVTAFINMFKAIGKTVTEFGSWLGRNLANIIAGKELESMGTLVVNKIVPAFSEAAIAAKEEFNGVFDELKTSTSDASTFMGDALGVSWEQAKIDADGYIEKLREMGTATVESVTTATEALDPFWEAMRTNMEQFSLQAGDLTQQLADLTFNTMMNLADGIGKAFADSVVMGKSFATSLKALTKQVLASVIQMLIKIGIQRLILAALEKKTNVSKAGEAVGVATANGVASWAAAPWPINLGAPAFGAAMGAAASAGVGIAGAAHGGLTSVPSEATYLLNKGERVLSPNQNKDFTDFMGNGEGVGNGGVTINNLEMHVLENATNAEALLDIDPRDMEEIVASKFIDALNALDGKGVRPVFAERGE